MLSSLHSLPDPTCLLAEAYEQHPALLFMDERDVYVPAVYALCHWDIFARFYSDYSTHAALHKLVTRNLRCGGDALSRESQGRFA